MSRSELESKFERLLDWATTDLVGAVLSVEGLTYVMMIGVPLLISLLYLKFKR